MSDISHQPPPRRHSFRLPGYDYSQPGGYFVTMVTQDRACVFGVVVGGEMCLNPAGQMIQWFKTMTTNDYIRCVKQFGWAYFNRRLWQRNYYEHILRNHDDLRNTHAYIQSNPLNWADDEENPVRSF